MKLPKLPSPPGKMAVSVKMGEKGQIVIPKEMREQMGYGPGDTLLVLYDKKRGLAIPNAEQAHGIFANIFGALDAEAES